MKKFIFILVSTMLAIHLPAPTITLNISTLGGHELQIIGSGSGFSYGQPYRWILLATTNYIHWVPVSTNVFSGSITVTNVVQATNKMIFYRVEVQG
jgi:hypothetical protein